jgi:hypothetical protein
LLKIYNGAPTNSDILTTAVWKMFDMQSLMKNTSTVFFSYINENFIPITSWRLKKKLKMTLPTHPQRTTFQRMPLLTHLNSRGTLPLKLE